MNSTNDKIENIEQDAWIKKNLNAAVNKYMEKGIIKNPVIEAKPAWQLPFQILIGKIRSGDHQDNFHWFICGEVPTDYVESSVAKTPREAARHFCMKWQLTASRYDGQVAESNPAQLPLEDVIKNLIDQSQALNDVVIDDRLW